jgi:hypothetical protein
VRALETLLRCLVHHLAPHDTTQKHNIADADLVCTRLPWLPYVSNLATMYTLALLPAADMAQPAEQSTAGRALALDLPRNRNSITGLSLHSSIPTVQGPGPYGYTAY